MSGSENNASRAGNYAEVNGLDMYYEVHGSGEPLVLLHGGVGAIEMFGEVLGLLAEGRQVVAVDLQAHGRTADIDRPMSFEAMADDIAALIEHLGLERADVMGYSLGGGVALQTAIRRPEVVRKLVLVSTPFNKEGWYPEVRAGMDGMGPEAAEPMKATPMYGLYSSIAPRPEDWPVLLTKLGELLRRDYDLSKEVAEMETRTMLVVGDADSIPPAHAAEFFGLLGGGKRDAGWDGSGMPDARLAILPATTHYDIFSSPALVTAVEPFLDAPTPEGDSAASVDDARSSSHEPEGDLPGGLSGPARRALAGAGYVKLEQFTTVSEAEVLRLHGMGPKALGQICRALAARGQSFANGS